jgi:hypothetical protein
MNEFEVRGGAMNQLRDFIQVQTTMGETMCIDDVAITPESQAVMIRWPFGGMVWNRPAAVVVQRNGVAERIPIVDVTRAIQLGLLGLSTFFALIAFAVSMCRSSKKGG